jgi:hypothetical protein
MSAPGIIPLPEIDDGQTRGYGDAWLVTVFNNEYNTWDEVVDILLIATGCTIEEAEIETWEIDRLGKSVVHHGAEQDCRDAAEIIATIGIRVEVTQE